MDRRQLLELGTAIAAAGVVPAADDATAASRASVAPVSFTGVNFAVDGLGLTPREYAMLLDMRARSAELQPDYYSTGGFVESLEEIFAHLLGKEMAVYLPTGTLANHLAVRSLARSDRRVLVQAESHLYNDSGDCLETLSGLNVIPLAPGHATFSQSDVRAWVERS